MPSRRSPSRANKHEQSSVVGSGRKRVFAKPVNSDSEEEEEEEEQVTMSSRKRPKGRASNARGSNGPRRAKGSANPDALEYSSVRPPCLVEGRHDVETGHLIVDTTVPEGEEPGEFAPVHHNKVMDEDRRERLIGDVMRHILFCNQNTVRCTTESIRNSSEIFKDLNKMDQIRLLGVAQMRFREVFGYRMVSTDQEDLDRDGTVKQAQTKKQKLASGAKLPGFRGTKEAWFLVNELDSEEINLAAHTDDDSADRAFLMVVLGVIMLSNSAITDIHLKEQLQELGLRFSEKRKGSGSSGSGQGVNDPDTLLNKLKDQMYLRKRKKQKERSEEGHQIYEYSFGERATQEIGRDNVVRFLMQTTSIELSQAEILGLLREEAPDEVVEEEEGEEEEGEEEQQQEEEEEEEEQEDVKPRGRGGRSSSRRN